MTDLRLPRPGRPRRDTWTAYLFSAPATLLLAVFLILPFGLALVLSFTNQRLIPSEQLPTAFVGLRNYLRLWQDDTLRRALANNALFVLVVVPVQTLLALGLALLVNQRLPGVQLFRGAFFLPVATIMAVDAVIWYLLYLPDHGTINALLEFLSFGRLGPYDWLGDTRLALGAIMLLSIWQSVGYQMLVFLAGLQGVRPELYEAAAIDGAGAWRQFVHVTLPQLRNTSIFVVVTTTIYAFQLFDQVYILPTRGGPQDATTTTVLRLVVEGFSNQRVGYASAISVVFFMLVLAVSALQRRLVREEREV